MKIRFSKLGGSGAFLDLVLENTGIKETYNMELVYDAYKKQVNGGICLMGGNALDLPFKDRSFEWVVIKNLLHHLVGRTRKESKAFAKRAVEELIRVAKDGGLIVLTRLQSGTIIVSLVQTGHWSENANRNYLGDVL